MQYVGLEKFIEIIADNIDQNEIPQIFDSDHNQELMERIIEALNLSEIQ